MLVALCIGSVYSGSITAFLVIPFRSSPINSVEEMLDSDVIPCGRSKTNTVANIIVNTRPSNKIIKPVSDCF
ncbi:hypothetical protein E2C01_093560 [Portunus trituberculatus]|uniref:Ionotropic glutamate receptor C-terminal domain-containing protein n=1 Tax=Portunus trituberculatus TaxID=210409 RepID=A0A5B7K0S5_PORTR|nr:hypothetical protein [Portunus trituberculatus]